MSGILYWIEVCGNVTEDDAFWSDGISVNTSSPDFTRCFQKTLLSAAPCLYLWLACVIYVPYLCVRPTINNYKDISTFNIFKSVLCSLLIVITTMNLVNIAIHHVRSHPHQLGDFLQHFILFVTYILAGFVNYYEYKKGIHSGGVLFFYWGLTVVLNIVTFRSRILHVEYDEFNSPVIDELFLFITFYVAYAVQLTQFFCTLFSDTKALPWVRKKRSIERQPLLGDNYEEVEKNPCPEKTAPYWQRVSFLWITKLIIQGYRRTLEFRDLWSLLPDDKGGFIITNVMKQWEKEVKKTNYKMVVNHKEDLYSSISQKGETSQRDFLISSREHNIKNPELIQKFAGSDYHQQSMSYKMKVRAKEEQQKMPSFFNVMAKVFGPYYMLGGFYNFLYTIFNFISPQLLNLLITFIANGDPYVWRGYLYVILLFVVSQAKSFFNQNYWHCCYVVGLRLRTAVIGIVYRKALKLNNSAKTKSTIGEIVNLMSVDAQKLQDVPGYLHLLWGAPLTIAIALFFLWQQLGPSVMTGFGLMLLLVPLNAFVAQKNRKLQIKQMILKDQRLKVMNEVLNGIKVLKLYAWENSFRDRILAIREKELVTLKKAQYLNAVSTLSWFMAPYLVALGSFATYTLSSPSNVLDANKAFVSLSLFNIMNFPMSMLPGVISFGVQASVSVSRINKFLRNEELDPNNVTENISGDSAIAIENGSFTWSKDLVPSLRGINLKIPEGKLVAVVGQVGAGKSSLISAMMGEMEVMLGNVRSRGSVAYVPQQAWIQNATLQENILFGREKNNFMYEKVIDSCALTPDLQILPGGDQIEIGEKGINLSGGQKQRVSLARAVYQNSDIYLLDDPLSAVDAHVGKHIFEQVVGNTGMLKYKTRVLVTNAVNFLPKTDLIICLKDGVISEIGSYDELLCQGGAFAEFIEAYLKETSSDDSDESPEMSQFKYQLKQQLSYLSGTDINDEGTEGDTEADSDKGRSRHGSESYTSHSSKHYRKRSSKLKKTISVISDKELIEKEEKKVLDKKLTEEEAVMSGRVSFKVFSAWIKSCGIVASFLTMIFYIIYLSAQAGTNIWLSEWSSDPPTVNGTQDIEQRNMRIGVYGGIGIVQAIGTLGQAFAMAVATVSSSRIMHHQLLVNILRAPMSFFDTTPLGRIVNRFSKDVDTLDVNVPITLRIWMGTMSTVITTLFVISYSTPIFLAVMVPLGIFYFFVQRFYVTTSRQLRRIDSIKRSPIYIHFSESVTGSSSIRAYKQMDRFIQKSDRLVDENQMAYYPNIVSNRWLGITLDFIGNLIVLFSGLFAVLQRETITAGLAGLSITYALQITTTLNVWVRMTSDLENYIVAVERIKEYVDCPKEAASIVEGNRPGFGWPRTGKVDFERYSTRYRPGLDLVLENIECEINPGEQLAVVGRTGAGKSSLTLALFRILESARGKIMVDGVNIANIGLQDLRSRITIIPQDPVLFSGSLRMNLDPFEQYSDDEVWASLEQAHLKQFVQSLPTGLGFRCAEGGENLSVGQRQLVCLARALLRRTKILVLDEATAAVDLETDDLIQTTIRTEFKESTVITIAHRINTIMDYDRIMVLDKGKIVEMDTPSKLLENSNSIFHSMASDAGLI